MIKENNKKIQGLQNMEKDKKFDKYYLYLAH